MSPEFFTRIKYINRFSSATVHIFCVCIALAFALPGCSPVYYKPNRVAAPTLTDKGQVNFAASTNYAQFAFSPVNHFGFMASYSAFNSDGGSVKENARIVEVSGGYYYTMPDKKGKGKLLLDAYGGFARGAIDISRPLEYPGMTLSKYYIQPGVAYRTKYVEVSMNWRLADVVYDNYLLHSGTIYQELPEAKRNYLFAEPGITFRAGYKGIKMEFQWVHSIGLSSVAYHVEPDCLSVGIYAIINGYRKDKPVSK